MSTGFIGRHLPSLAHHWMILKASWAQENERAQTQKPLDETQFLPAALEIMETPPSPGLRMLLLSLCGMVLIALGWSLIGKLDVVAVATGKTLPADRVKVIQPIEIGVVRAIHVRDGQHVKAGDLLIELDPTVAGAEEAQASRGLLSAQVDRARSQALLNHLLGRRAIFAAPPGVPKDIATVQQSFIDTQIGEYEAQRAGLLQQRAEKEAERGAAREEISKLEETLPLLEKQIAARTELTNKGLSSKLLLWQLQEQQVERVRNIAIQKNTALKAQAAIAAIDQQLRELKQAFAKKAVGDLAKAEDDVGLRSEEVKKSEKRKVLQALHAPVSGTVQQLQVHTVGGVVQPAQSLMILVPDGSNLVVEAEVLNKDIGFVREGQPVRVKLEAFPFTDFGLLEGTVEQISRDAIQDEKRGLIYAARIRLHQKAIHIGGRDIPLGAGMAVQAEIKTGERRIIQYLLSPILKVTDEAGRER